MNEASNVLIAKLLSVFLLKLVDTAGCIHKLALAGEEWVRLVRDFHLYQRVLVAVFPLDSFLRAGSRLSEERLVARDVLENYCPVFCRMNSFFHCRFFFEDCKYKYLLLIYQISLHIL